MLAPVASTAAHTKDETMTNATIFEAERDAKYARLWAVEHGRYTMKQLQVRSFSSSVFHSQYVVVVLASDGIPTGEYLVLDENDRERVQELVRWITEKAVQA